MLYALIVILIVGVALLLYGWWDTNRFDVHPVEIDLERLPKSFDGLTILLISDLHNRAYGKDGRALEKTIERLSFDMTTFPGDLLDRHFPEKRQNGYECVKALAAKAPIFFSQGNHEFDIEDWKVIKSELQALNVRVLDEETITLDRFDERLTLCGIGEETSKETMQKLVSGSNCTILLAHHPERIREYADVGVDLVLSGHAHGGQVRLFHQGLFSPDQGILPTYTSGIYSVERTKLFVSRGAGNHSFLPPRIFNRPEINLITLKTPSR